MADNKEKVIDWGAIYKPFDPKAAQRAAGQPVSFKEEIQKAYQEEIQATPSDEIKKAQVPQAKEALMKALVTKEPIDVLKSFNNLTIGYHANELSGNIQIVKANEVVPVGEVLQFSHIDKHMGQFIFKSLKTDKEYAIFTGEDVQISFGQSIPNSGLYGLLFNTSIN